MVHVSRRTVLASAAAGAAAAIPFGKAASAAAPAMAVPAGLTGHDPVELRWLEGGAPAELAAGTTWGVPWPRGAFAPDQQFALTTSAGAAVPVQSWPTAWWPDGSVKWTAHALSGATEPNETYRLAAGTPAAANAKINVTTSGKQIVVDTGVIAVTFARSGARLVESITRGATVIAGGGRLVASSQDQPSTDQAATVRTQSFTGVVHSARVEQSGPVRAVVKIEGKHERGRNAWLPFVVRFYLYAGSDAIRVVHTFMFDGNEKKAFVNGLGVQFDVPMRDQLFDRHVRFAGDGDGVLAEAVRGITGLRRDPGAAVQQAQYEGKALPDPSTWDQRVTTRLQWIPAFGDYSLRQLNARGYEIYKRTEAGRSWVRVDGGHRAGGLAYVGSPTGGLAFGMRNFWQLHPTELEITGAASDTAKATAWMWSPRAGAMDLRFFHDGLGQDTYAKQLDALEITYEDYEPGFDTPYGVARTTELTF